MRHSLLFSWQNLTGAELDVGQIRVYFLVSSVSPMRSYIHACLHISSFVEGLTFNVPIMGSTNGSSSSFFLCPRAAEYLKMFFRRRSVFSETYRRLSASGKSDKEAFQIFLSRRAQRGLSTDSNKYIVRFSSVRCGEEDYETNLFNFATKISPSGAVVELDQAHDP